MVYTGIILSKKSIYDFNMEKLLEHIILYMSAEEDKHNLRDNIYITQRL